MSPTSIRRQLASVGLAMAVVLCFSGCASRHESGKQAGASEPVRVVVTTSLLQSAVRQIGGNHLSVDTLMPPGSCPGHFDVSPKDTKAVSRSDLILTHGYEGFVSGMLKSLGDGAPELVQIKTDGEWMLPSIYAQGARQVAAALRSVDSKNAESYERSLEKLEAECRALEADLKWKLEAVDTAGVSVLCSTQQHSLLEWMGFTVTGTYSRAEDFTPEMLHGLSELGKRKRVRLVVDNLQSGPTAGKELARDIGAAHVVLSSFPGGFSGTETWSNCLRDNVDRVIKGLERR